jgi:hypothetical protein
MFALAGATALTAASAANAAITIGASGTTSGTISPLITDNVNIPNKVEFDTTNAAAGSVTSFFDFSESFASQGIFTVGAATLPNSTVTLVELLTGSPLTLVSSAGPSPNSLTFTSGTLAAGQTYRFRYTVNLGSPGNISGNAAFYAAVPEPATWALMLLGFGGIGMAMRRRRRPALAQIA